MYIQCFGCSIAGVGDGPSDALGAVGIALQAGGGGPQAWRAGLGGSKRAFATPLQSRMWMSGFISYGFRPL